MQTQMFLIKLCNSKFFSIKRVLSLLCVCFNRIFLSSLEVRRSPMDVSGVISSKKYCVASKAESGSSCSLGISDRKKTNKQRCIISQNHLEEFCGYCCTPTRHDVHLVEDLQLLDEVAMIQNA